MQSTLFWCGSVALLGHLQREGVNNAITLILKTENIQGKNCTYTVLVNGVEYTYKFTLSSNTKLSGSFFIESSTWKSHVFNVEKVYDFVHIFETSIRLS